MLLYSVLLSLVLVLGAPFWLFRMATSGRYRRGLSQRLGLLPAELTTMVAGRHVIWLHAVSVGEVLAATELIGQLQVACGQMQGAGAPMQVAGGEFTAAGGGWIIAISTTTEAGQRLARQRFPELPVFYLPLDFPVIVRRYLCVLRPRMLLLMESEFWPNLLRETGRAGAVIAVVNARISDRSFPGYLRLRRLWRPILGPVTAFLAQGEETAGRLRAIGVPAEIIHTTGNLKYDVKAAPRGEVYERLREALPSGAPVLVAGSTLEGEEQRLLEVWREIRHALPEAILLLAPRHPDRFARVAMLITAQGFRCRRASELGEVPDRIGGGEVIVLDTIGDLAGIYALGTAAFVGGSLVPAGGHNPLEPARFGVPVLTGGSTYNFREVVDAMAERGGIRVLADNEDLSRELLHLLRGGADVRALGRHGESVFHAQAGATARSVDHLVRLLRAADETAPVERSDVMIEQQSDRASDQSKARAR